MGVLSISVNAGQLSAAVQINHERLGAGVTLLMAAYGVVGTYKVQVSNDPRVTHLDDLTNIPVGDPKYPTHWVDHEGLIGLSDSKSAIMLYMGQWLRIDATNMSAGSVNLGVAQAEVGQYPYLNPCR